MPVVTITLIEGYDEATRQGLARRLTDAVAAAIAAPPNGITVIVNEVPPGNYMRGRRGRTPGAPCPDPSDLVRRFLAAMEARDLDLAGSLLAEGFTMTFPGDVVFRRLDELVAWAKPRYRFVRKSFERFDEAPAADGVAVTCFGTLSGEWPDGSAFADIRFIDRFLVRDGRLVEQQVWNDLAEVRG